MRYVVIDSNGLVRYFEDAEAVTLFMMRKDKEKFFVYQRMDGLSNNATKMQEQLEGRETT